MANVAAFAVTPALRRSPAIPSHAGLKSRARYWRNWIYLGIGELSLTWPVAAFLRGL
jgi:hypothetical protein